MLEEKICQQKIFKKFFKTAYDIPGIKEHYIEINMLLNNKKTKEIEWVLLFY